MNCNRINEYIYSFLDGELDSQTSSLVKEHFSTCPLCSLEFEQEKKIDSLISDNIPKEKASYELKEAILDKIEEAENKTIQHFIFPIITKPVAAVTLAILFIAILTIPILVNINKPFPIFSESVSNHIKFLQGGLPVEIASNNTQEINAWFQGKLDFRVRVPDYSTKGVQLLGGRLCSIQDKPVAYIMYEKKGCNVSFFMFDAAGFRCPKSEKLTIAGKDRHITAKKGYHSIFWVDKGIGCVLVSDLSIKELIQLVS